MLLFAEEFGPVTLSTMAAAVLAAVVSAVMTVLNFRRAGKKEDKAEQRLDVERVLAQQQELYERQKKQCEEDKAELNLRIDGLEVRLDRSERTADKLRDVYTQERARARYYASLLRQNQVRFEDFDPGTAELPALDSPPPPPSGGKPS